MVDTRAEELLAAAREIEARDVRIATQIEELGALDSRAAAFRERAVAVRMFLVRLPSERAHLEQALREAEAGVAGARDALAEAERALAEAEARRRPDEGRLATARRIAAHARDAADAAEHVLARVEARRAALEAEAERLRAEASSLEGAAHALAADLRAQARVSDSGGAYTKGGLDELLEWLSRARAAILVARGGLEVERERVVREANELSGAVLGEEPGTTRAADVRERIERALRL